MIGYVFYAVINGQQPPGPLSTATGLTPPHFLDLAILLCFKLSSSVYCNSVVLGVSCFSISRWRPQLISLFGQMARLLWYVNSIASQSLAADRFLFGQLCPSILGRTSQVTRYSLRVEIFRALTYYHGTLVGIVLLRSCTINALCLLSFRANRDHWPESLLCLPIQLQRKAWRKRQLPRLLLRSYRLLPKQGQGKEEGRCWGWIR